MADTASYAYQDPEVANAYGPPIAAKAATAPGQSLSDADQDAIQKGRYRAVDTMAQEGR